MTNFVIVGWSSLKEFECHSRPLRLVPCLVPCLSHEVSRERQKPATRRTSIAYNIIPPSPPCRFQGFMQLPIPASAPMQEITVAYHACLARRMNHNTKEASSRTLMTNFKLWLWISWFVGVDFIGLFEWVS